MNEQQKRKLALKKNILNMFDDNDPISAIAIETVMGLQFTPVETTVEVVQELIDQGLLESDEGFLLSLTEEGKEVCNLLESN